MYSCHKYRLSADTVHVNTCTRLNIIEMNVTKLSDEISHTKLLTYLGREREREREEREREREREREKESLSNTVACTM